MVFADERIAELEREFRRQKREELEREKQKALPKEEIKMLTFEEILEGVRQERLVFPNKEAFEFEVREYFEDRIPMVRFNHFFNGAEEQEGVAIYVNHDREVSQLIMVADEAPVEESVEAWKERLETGVQAIGAYVKVEKTKRLANIDYLVYKMPTKKGWVFNVIFRIRYGSNRVFGNYNCMERDKETIGLILEALLYRMDELLTEREKKKEGEG